MKFILALILFNLICVNSQRGQINTIKVFLNESNKYQTFDAHISILYTILLNIPSETCQSSPQIEICSKSYPDIPCALLWSPITIYGSINGDTYRDRISFINGMCMGYNDCDSDLLFNISQTKKGQCLLYVTYTGTPN